LKNKKTVKRRVTAAALSGIFALCALAGCGSGGYKDGVYTAVSGEDDRGAVGEITITTEDGKISDCRFVTRQSDGTLKDENYGKQNGEITDGDVYAKAQLAVKAMESYSQQLKNAGKLSGVDAVSGATTTYNQFREAAAKALRKARSGNAS
jgi:major membrane immunogen (membrane-anchored lipoprotein)